MTGAADLSLAILLGGTFAAGVLLCALRVRGWASVSLSQRIAPYLRDLSDPRGLTPLAAPTGMRGALGRAIARLGAVGALDLRLAQAGRSTDAGTFRGRQLAWGLVGTTAGAAVIVILVATGRAQPAALVGAPILGALCAVAYESFLTRDARMRHRRIEEELPTVLEFLALCVSAGEGLRDAVLRVSEVGTGELTAELRRAGRESGTGTSFGDALTAVARRLDVPGLTRAVDHLVAALEHGAPLAHVLHDQAVDAREDAKRVLIEAAGRKEILMLLPLVFLLLPMSVLFAVFPGVFMLRLGAG